MQNSNTPLFSVTLFHLKLLWVALLVSQLFYFTTLFQLKRQTLPHEIGAPFHPLFFPFVIAAGLFLACATLVPYFLFRSRRRQIKSPNPSTNELVSIFFLPILLRLIFLEAVTVIGFIVVIATKYQADFILPFFAVSMLGFLICRPTESKLRSFL